MASLNKIWIEEDLITKRQIAIRIDWNNGRHQRIEIVNDSPKEVHKAFLKMSRRLASEQYHGEI